jgi:hypothetical protein
MVLATGARQDRSGRAVQHFYYVPGLSLSKLETAAALCSAGLGRAVVIDRLPPQQSRLRPGSRKLKQTLPFLVGLGG